MRVRIKKTGYYNGNINNCHRMILLEEGQEVRYIVSVHLGIDRDEYYRCTLLDHCGDNIVFIKAEEEGEIIA